MSVFLDVEVEASDAPSGGSESGLTTEWVQTESRQAGEDSIPTEDGGRGENL